MNFYVIYYDNGYTLTCELPTYCDAMDYAERNGGDIPYMIEEWYDQADYENNL